MSLGTGALTALDLPNNTGESRHESVLEFVAEEINAGMTSLTIAIIALDMGQVDRGARALVAARDAFGEALRSSELLSMGQHAQIAGRLEQFRAALHKMPQQRPVLSPILRQPSMS